MKRTPKIGIGLMCGTSHDGLDIAVVAFDENDQRYSYEILHGEEVALPPSIYELLEVATTLNAIDLYRLDIAFSDFSAQEVRRIVSELKHITPDFIASHGVTIFHQPELGITHQLGSGARIAAGTGITTVCDFRSQDVAKGGQGAPLVPFCDRMLFSDFDYTLNLGGFANLTVLHSNDLVGYDVCPCNLPLNAIAQRIGLKYDDAGKVARTGEHLLELYDLLNKHPYFDMNPPKSLGYEWFSDQVLPHLSDSYRPEDLLRTTTEHIAYQIGRQLLGTGTCLVSGGGAFNDFLLDRISAHTSVRLKRPSDGLVQFKEAVCFAFLGLRRLSNQKNIAATVTGAQSDSCAGAVYLP